MKTGARCKLSLVFGIDKARPCSRASMGVLAEPPRMLRSVTNTTTTTTPHVPARGPLVAQRSKASVPPRLSCRKRGLRPRRPPAPTAPAAAGSVSSSYARRCDSDAKPDTHPVLPVRPVRGSQLRRCTGALDPPSRIGPGSAGASIVIIVISTPLTIMWTLSPLVDSPGMMMQQSCPLRCGLHCLGMLVIAQDLPMHGMQCI